MTKKDRMFYDELLKFIPIECMFPVVYLRSAPIILGDWLWSFILLLIAALTLYQALKLLYIVSVRVRGTWIMKIVPKKIKELD